MSDASSRAGRNPRRRHGARYRARARAVDLLFEAELRDLDPVALLDERVEFARDPELDVEPIADYTRQIVTGVAEELDDVDAVISRHLTSSWQLNRLPGVERAVLRVAVWELLDNADVPLKVALTEGVELASQYSDEKASGYVNSLLDRVVDAARARRAQASSVESQESPDSPTEDDGGERASADEPPTQSAAGERTPTNEAPAEAE